MIVVVWICVCFSCLFVVVVVVVVVLLFFPSLSVKYRGLENLIQGYIFYFLFYF